VNISKTDYPKYPKIIQDIQNQKHRWSTTTLPAFGKKVQWTMVH